jgi:CBS domain-containing protein
MARDGAATLGFQVQQLMSTPILSCRSSDRVDAVLATMTIARIRHLPVIEDNELKGIVSIGDLVKHRLDCVAPPDGTSADHRTARRS